jgi:hypothetical protein
MLDVAADDAGGVHQDIQAAEARKHPLDRGSIAHVENRKRDAGTVLLLGCPRAFRLGGPRRGHPRPQVAEGTGAGKADAARAARDQHRLAVEQARGESVCDRHAVTRPQIVQGVRLEWRRS